MKYLQKFNESNENYITQADFDLIEDLFLFWSDEGKPINYYQRLKAANQGGHEIWNSEIQEKCVNVKLNFLFYRRSLEQHEFEKIFGFVPSRDTDASYKITNISDIERRDGPFPARPGSNIQKVLNVLDPKQDFKKDLMEILSKTKGLDHYGFAWSLKFDCDLAIYRGFFLKGLEFSVNTTLMIQKK